MRGISVQIGHSMTEILVSVSILSGVVAVAAPPMADMIEKVRLRGGMLAITQGLNLARAEGIRRNGRVVICKSSGGNRCTTDGSWDQGWIIFHDPNNNGDVDAGEAVLYREPAMTGRIRLYGNQPVQSYVSYTSFGKAKLFRDGFQAGHFTVCAQSANPTAAYLVYVDRLGSPRVEKTTVPFCA